MPRRYASRRRSFRQVRRRNYRYLIAQNTNSTNVGVNNSTVNQLITPTILAGIGMTGKITVASIQGHYRWSVNSTFACAASGTVGLNGRCAMGVYVDSDTFDPASVRLPLQDGQSSNWMLHRTASLAYAAHCNGTNIASTDGQFQTQWLRFNTRKYKRRMDASNDTLAMVVQNSAQSNATISYDFYYRILILE